uniref:4-nitrophenylphosphatase n=1 Tax=Megaselia scalaris TaxID=36166 RepID=T1GWB9_MEGSC
MRAHQYLMKNSNCLFLTGASDKKLSVKSGVNIMAPGYFMEMLAMAAKKVPIALGKPSKDLSDLVMEKFAIKDRKRVLMIGDMLEQDIGFGKNSGFQTMLVLTGGTKKDELLDDNNSHLIPDYIADGMIDFVKFFDDLNKSKM